MDSCVTVDTEADTPPSSLSRTVATEGYVCAYGDAGGSLGTTASFDVDVVVFAGAKGAKTVTGDFFEDEGYENEPMLEPDLCSISVDVGLGGDF